MNATALLWDLDGTLVDSEPVHGVAVSRAVAELGVTVSEDFHARTLGLQEAKVHQMLVAETHISLDLDEWRAVKWAHFSRHAEAIRPRPGVAKVALDWAARGTPSAVVSNSAAAEVTMALAAAGLNRALTTVVSLDDVTCGKPDPQGYLRAARRLGVAPERCLVIEDSPIGAAAGVAAGMQVVFHPQAPSDPAAAPGTAYLPPGASLAELVSNAMTTGKLS